MEPNDNWIMIQAKYDWIALPIDIGVEVLKHARMVTEGYKTLEISDTKLAAQVISNDAMTVAIAKSKMVPKEDP